MNHENGQIAIYDAVNPLSEGRRSLAKEFSKHEVETLFIESACDDEKIIEENVRSVKISSPDYIGWSLDAAVKHYLARMSAKIPHFETMEEPDLNYIKMINAGERITVNNCSFGYLSHRYVRCFLGCLIFHRCPFWNKPVQRQHTVKWILLRVSSAQQILILGAKKKGLASHPNGSMLLNWFLRVGMVFVLVSCLSRDSNLV